VLAARIVEVAGSSTAVVLAAAPRTSVEPSLTVDATFPPTVCLTAASAGATVSLTGGSLRTELATRSTVARTPASEGALLAWRSGRLAWRSRRLASTASPPLAAASTPAAPSDVLATWVALEVGVVSGTAEVASPICELAAVAVEVGLAPDREAAVAGREAAGPAARALALALRARRQSSNAASQPAATLRSGSFAVGGRRRLC